MLETRNGMVGAVPSAMMPAGSAPTEAEIAAHYAKIRGAFTVPEQRALKYAVFGVENVKNAVPTDADIAAYYQANAAKYASTEKRVLSQVVLPDQAAANAFSAKIKAGQSFDMAAKAAGFAASDTAIGSKSRADLAAFSSNAVATAAFALPKGGVTAPVQSDLGWHVVRIDAIQTTPGKTLAQARAEIFGSLAQQKGDEALIDFVNKVEDQLTDGASLDEVAKTHHLTVVKSPLLTATGQSVNGQPVTIAPELRGLLKSGFAMGADDEPMVETLIPNKRFAILGVDQALPAAPLPLAKVRDAVVADLMARRGAAAAQKLAASIAAKVNAGASMNEAFAAAKLPAPKGVSARRVDLANQQNVPAPVVLMFSMAKGKAKLLPAPNNQGWMVVYVAEVKRGNIAEAPALITQSGNEIRAQMGNEYATQFANAAKTALGFKENKTQLLALKKRLSGAAAE
jgi:peptidyl-prolyl cis-trans isomerase D